MTPGTGVGIELRRSLLRNALLLCTCAALLVCFPGAALAGESGLHSDFDRFLGRHVDESGKLDYSAALRDSAELDRYVAWLERVSPDSHPELFPGTEHELSYWINAYNAWVVRKVLDHYPIASVRDVRPPRWLFFLPRLAGFFVFETITLGGSQTNLRALENKIIRKRFGEPRVHFALNCASLSCPRLPKRAFSPGGLEAELTRETRHFLADSAHVRIDAREHIVAISSIFKWYEGDFKDWMKQYHPGEPATLLGYLANQLPETEARALRECGDCRVEFMEYDWSLNGRSAAE